MTETEKDHIHGMHIPEHRGSVAENPPLDDDLFTRELGYQACLSIVHKLFGSGILTVGEAHKAKGLLLAMYRPPIGTLWAEAG